MYLGRIFWGQISSGVEVSMTMVADMYDVSLVNYNSLVLPKPQRRG